MTIDEAIAHEIEVAAIQRNNDKLNKTLGKSSPYYNTDCIKCAEEHEQLADWLEELKSYRASVFSGDMTQKMLKEEYNKAIDDFVHECDKCCGFYTGNNKNLTREDILNIAEQLKVGGIG